MYFTAALVTDKWNNNEITHDNKLTTRTRLLIGGILGDTFLSITALVIGILGATGALDGMTSAATYTLISVSGVISLSWIFMAAVTKGASLDYAKRYLKAAVSSNPRSCFWANQQGKSA